MLIGGPLTLESWKILLQQLLVSNAMECCGGPSSESWVDLLSQLGKCAAGTTTLFSKGGDRKIVAFTRLQKWRLGRVCRLSLFGFHSANRFISYFRWNLRRGLMLNELHSCIYFARICIRTLYDFVGILPSQLFGFQSQDGTLRVSQVPRSSRSSAEECSNWQKQECNVAILPWALKATNPPPPTPTKKHEKKQCVCSSYRQMLVVYTLPETNTSHLKTGGWKMNFLLG